MFIARINASRLQTMRSRLQILCSALSVVIVIAGVYSIALAEEKASAWELRSGLNQNGDIPEPIANDFPALGKAFKNLNEEEYSLLTSISMERHFALNWLCGYSNDWDKTPTDT